MTANINKILALPANKGCSSWGAAMGRRNYTDGNPEKLHLQRVRFYDGAYDAGGAYWGLPADLWCAFSTDASVNDYEIRVFVRAANRSKAKEAVVAKLTGKGWTFFR